MRIFVRHTRSGQIVSVVKARVLPQGVEHPFAELTEDESVLEVEPAGEVGALDSHEILERYTVDAGRQRLAPRDEVAPAAPSRRRGKPER
jgi:hypothetical protein